MLNVEEEDPVGELDSGALVFVFSLVLGVVGAVVFVLGISPLFMGRNLDLLLTGLGIALIIIGIVSAATLLE